MALAYLHPADIGGRAFLAPADVPAGSPPSTDNTEPTFTGDLTYTATAGSITVDWSGAVSADNVAVERREYRIGGAGAFSAATSAEEASKKHTFIGLDASTPYVIDVRCVDTSGNVSASLTIGVMTAATSGGGTGGTTNYIRGTLATRAGIPHVNLASLSWSLFSQLLPANFGAPVVKGTHAMTAGSPELKIAVSSAAVPAGWYMLAISDPDGTTTILARVLVGP